MFNDEKVVSDRMKMNKILLHGCYIKPCNGCCFIHSFSAFVASVSCILMTFIVLNKDG